MGAATLLFDSDTMWVLVLAGLAACMLSRGSRVASLGNGPPVPRDTGAAFPEDDSEMNASFPLETLFGQQAPAPVNGDEIDDFLVDVSGFTGNSGFVGTV